MIKFVKKITDMFQCTSFPKEEVEQIRVEVNKAKAYKRISQTDLNGDKAFKQMFNHCRSIIFGVEVQENHSEQIKEIEEEYEKGEDYNQLLTTFMQELGPSSDTAIGLLHSSVLNLIRYVQSCNDEDCINREQCTLRFRVRENGTLCEECVWISLYRNITNLGFIKNVIKEIGDYMQDSEKNMEDKFNF